MATYFTDTTLRESLLFDLVTAAELLKTGEHDASATSFTRGVAERLVALQRQNWQEAQRLAIDDLGLEYPATTDTAEME